VADLNDAQREIDQLKAALVALYSAVPFSYLTDTADKLILSGNQIVYDRTSAFASTIFGDGGNNLLHTTGTEGYYNLFAGIGAGAANTKGYMNVFGGVNAGVINTVGYFNTFLGGNTGAANIDGHEDTFVGQAAGYKNTNGCDNAFFGQLAGGENTTGQDNAFFGQESGAANVSGDQNTYIGRMAGGSPYYYGTLTGLNSRNIFLGYAAGSLETGSDTLIIDDRARATEAAQRDNAIIYGIMANTGYGQTLTFNARFVNIKGGDLYLDDSQYLYMDGHAAIVASSDNIYVGNENDTIIRSGSGFGMTYFKSTGSLLIGTATDGMTSQGSIAIAKDLMHRGAYLGFYNHAPAAQPTKAGHNNRAAVSDVVAALVAIGLFDTA
jgi:hypothetical protein